MATANESLLDATVAHQIGLQRLSNATVRKIIALLNRSELELVEKMKRFDGGPWTAKRMQKLLEALRTANKEAYAVLRAELDADLKALAIYEGDYQTTLLASTIPVQLDIVTPTSAQLKAAVDSRPFQGRLLKEWYSELEASAQTRLRGAIRMGFVEGETIDQMVRRVRGTKALQYKDGILEASRRGAEALVRTAVNHTANSARAEVFRQNSDVVKGVQWVATLDGRTTLVCASRDGTIYPVDSGPRPPAHINCRSTTVAVLKSWKEMGISLSEAPEGTRASMDGQVAAKTTYDKWLRGRSVEFQEDILGVQKSKLFRQGGLTLDKFVDRNGAEYTLDELRKRESAAFAKAGL